MRAKNHFSFIFFIHFSIAMEMDFFFMCCQYELNEKFILRYAILALKHREQVRQDTQKKQIRATIFHL